MVQDKKRIKNNMTFSNSGYGVAEALHTVLPICCQCASSPTTMSLARKLGLRESRWLYPSLPRARLVLSCLLLPAVTNVVSPSLVPTHPSTLQTALGLCSQDFWASLNLKSPTRACVLEHMVPSWSQFGEVVESLRSKTYPLSVGH